MSDKKKSGSSIFPFFVDGEQPSANKFNSISIQTRANLYVLEKTIGDIWAESEPYVSSTNRKLSGDISKKTSFELNPGSDEKGYSLNIPSIGRLLGPISKLNPFNLTEGLSNGRVNVDLERDIVEDISENVYSHSLKYPGTNILSITGSGSPTNLVSSSTLLSVSGDYFYDTDRSVVYFYDKSGPDWVIEYTTIPSQYNGGSSYTGSSANLIPDEAYMNSQGVGVTVTLNGDYYSVLIPSVAHQNLTSEEGVVLESNEINYGVQLKLPNVLRALYGSDYFDNNGSVIGEHLIPEGFLYLKNYSTGEIYTQGEYYFISDTEIKIVGIEIENPSTDIFCIATIGTDITSSIQDLKLKQFHHSHSREFGEPLVPVSSIGSITDKEGSSGPFTKSENVSNFAPQYLHRDGYDGVTDTGLNDQNAMRGDLLIGKSAGSAGSYVGSGSSYKLLFGNEDTSISRGGTQLSIRNEGNIVSTGYDLTLRGDNTFQSSDTNSDIVLERFTDFDFKCEPNEYRSSATQRPGGFVFRGGPVYFQGLDAFNTNQGGTVTSTQSLGLAKKRDEIVCEDSDKINDSTMGGNQWKCPGIGMATIYLNDVTFDRYPVNTSSSGLGLVTVSPFFLDILLPSVGNGSEEQHVTSNGTATSGIDVRITTNQILNITGIIKNKSSNTYTTINGSGHGTNETTQEDHLTGPAIMLRYSQTPDDPNTKEYIRVVLPYGNKCLWDSDHLLEYPANPFDLRLSIFYLTHR